jgi:hypothetical protein
LSISGNPFTDAARYSSFAAAADTDAIDTATHYTPKLCGWITTVDPWLKPRPVGASRRSSDSLATATGKQEGSVGQR